MLIDTQLLEFWGLNMSDQPDDMRGEKTVTSRRVLMLGAVGATTVLTIRPALAQTTTSVLNCTIPIPDPASSGQYIAADGSLVPADTPGAFPPAPRSYTGLEAKEALSHGNLLPGTNYDQNQAYINYIGRLQHGQSGFTCYASLQMPGR
jgi:hypothetical protein